MVLYAGSYIYVDYTLTGGLLLMLWIIAIVLLKSIVDEIEKALEEKGEPLG